MKRTITLPSAALAIALIVGAAACGDDGPGTDSTDSTVNESTSPPATDAVTTEPAITEPTDDTDASETTAGDGSSEPAGTAEAGEEPTEESASDVVVGLPEDDAIAAAEAEGWELRVVNRDGEDLPVTMDLRPNRVNVAVIDGEVTEVLSIG
jgi:hypothetical protein